MPLDHRRLGVLALTCLVAAAAGSVAVAAQPQGPVSLPSDLGPQDEALRRLFTPAAFPEGTFTVYRSAEAVGRLAARLKALDSTPVDGAWAVERSGVFDALGVEGPYDKGRVARLFGGSLPWVARGSLQTREGRLAVTLISPYPDASLASLHDGTMVIVTKLPSPRPRDGEP